MLRLFVPSKTFLLGEYAVLHGGAALVATTRPEFIADMDFVVRPSSEGVRFAGPAGRLHENLSLSSGLRIQQFLDPHFGKGGFGASSAQYLSVYLAPSIDKVSEVHPVPISLARAREMVAQFQTDSHALGNGRPSGVDLVAQWLGGMAQVDLNGGALQSSPWPWPDLGFLIARTGLKVPTHEHLKIPPKFDSEKLIRMTQMGMDAFLSGEDTGFCESLRHYGEALRDQGLWLESVSDKVRQIYHCDGVLAAKGCGALGADVVAVVFRNSRREIVSRHLKELGLEPVASEKDLSGGLRAEWRKDQV